MATQTAEEALPKLRRSYRPAPVQVLAFVFIAILIFWLGINLADNPSHFFDLFLVGLTIGMVYALIALGYSLVYGILELINFAHGDVFMLGAMMTTALVGTFGLATHGSVIVWIVPMLDHRLGVHGRDEHRDRDRSPTGRCAAHPGSRR